MQAGEGIRNWHVLSVARVLFFDHEMIEQLFAINLNEALHCREGITKHTDMNRQNERGGHRKVPVGTRKRLVRTYRYFPAPESPQDGAGKTINTGSLRRRKVPRSAPENDQPAQTGSLRRRKVTDFRRRLGSDLSAPEMWNK